MSSVSRKVTEAQKVEMEIKAISKLAKKINDTGKRAKRITQKEFADGVGAQKIGPPTRGRKHRIGVFGPFTLYG